MGDADASDTGAAGSGAGPDWAQFWLVIVIIAIISLAAVTIPALGGVGAPGHALGGSGQGEPSSLQDAIASDVGEQQQRAGDADSSGDDGGSLDEGTESEPSSELSGEQADGPGDEMGDQAGDGMGDGPGDGTSDGPADEFGEPGDGEATEPNVDGAFDGESGEPGDLENGPRDQRAGASDPGEIPADEFDGGFGGEPGDEFGDGSDAAGDGAGEDGTGEFEEGSSGGEFGDRSDGTIDGQADGGDSTVGDQPSESTGSETGRVGEPGSGSASGPDSESGSTADPDGDAGETSSGANTDDSGSAEGGYDVSFDDSPTPGSDVTVTVTDGDSPVPGAQVFFNDEAIGTTDETGSVTGTVPFTETLDVLVVSSGTADRDRQRSLARGGNDGGAVGGGGGGIHPALTGAGASPRQFHATGATPPQFHATAAQAENETRTTVELNPETALALDGLPATGATVTLSATVNDNPIPRGTVLIDGDERGTTDADGTAQVTLPESPGNVTIAVERDEIRAERTLEVRGLSLEVAERIPLPGRAVDAEFQYGNESVANATVLVDGAAAATTDADGTATVTLPIASEATLEAAYGGTTTTTTVGGLYRNAALLGAGAIGIVLGGGWFLRQRVGITGEHVRSLPATLAGLVQRAGRLLRSLGRRSVDAIVRLAQRLEGLGYWLHNRGRDAAMAIRRAGRWLVGLPRDLADRGLAALAVLHPIRLYRFVVAAIRPLFRSSQQRMGDVTSRVSNTGATRDEPGESTEESVHTLRELWQEFVRLVRPPRLRTKTPGEIGRYAVEKGFPEPPVRTVVDVFRDSEYGNAAPSADRLERVRTAVRSVADDPDGSDELDERLEPDPENASDRGSNADVTGNENGGETP